MKESPVKQVRVPRQLLLTQAEKERDEARTALTALSKEEE